MEHRIELSGHVVARNKVLKALKDGEVDGVRATTVGLHPEWLKRFEALQAVELSKMLTERSAGQAFWGVPVVEALTAEFAVITFDNGKTVPVELNA